MVTPNLSLASLSHTIASIDILNNYYIASQLLKSEREELSTTAREKLKERLERRKRGIKEELIVAMPPPMSPPPHSTDDHSSLSQSVSPPLPPTHTLPSICAQLEASNHTNIVKALPLVRQFMALLQTTYYDNNTNGSGEAGSGVQFSDTDAPCVAAVFGIYKKMELYMKELEVAKEDKFLGDVYRTVGEGDYVQLSAREGETGCSTGCFTMDTILRPLHYVCHTAGSDLSRSLSVLPLDGGSRLQALSGIHGGKESIPVVNVHLFSCTSKSINRIDLALMLAALPCAYAVHLTCFGFTLALGESVYCDEEKVLEDFESMFRTRLVYTERGVVEGRKVYLTLCYGNGYPNGGGTHSVTSRADLRGVLGRETVRSTPDVTLVTEFELREGNVEGVLENVFNDTSVVFVACCREACEWLRVMWEVLGNMGVGKAGTEGIVETQSGGYFILHCEGKGRFEAREQGEGSKEKGEIGEIGEVETKKEEHTADPSSKIPAAAPQFLKDLILTHGAKMYNV